jgi:hypothetical protein
MSEACVWANDFWFGTLGFQVLRATKKAAANTASRRISEKHGMRLDCLCDQHHSELH